MHRCKVLLKSCYKSVFFSINQKLLANLPIEEYRNNVAFHIFLYANAQSFTETGHLKLYVRDGITKTDTTLDLIAEGEMTVPTRIDTQNNEEEADLSWAEGYGDNWTFDKDHFVSRLNPAEMFISLEMSLESRAVRLCKCD